MHICIFSVTRNNSKNGSKYQLVHKHFRETRIFLLFFSSIGRIDCMEGFGVLHWIFHNNTTSYRVDWIVEPCLNRMVLVEIPTRTSAFSGYIPSFVRMYGWRRSWFLPTLTFTTTLLSFQTGLLGEGLFKVEEKMFPRDKSPWSENP